MYLGPAVKLVQKAIRESTATGRQMWVESRDDTLRIHLAHQRGWNLQIIVIGDDLIDVPVEDN